MRDLRGLDRNVAAETDGDDPKYKQKLFTVVDGVDP
jgi:hypothetical protein